MATTGQSAERFGKSVWFWVRTHRKTFALLIAVVFALDLTTLYYRFNSTTIVSSESAVDEFRQKQAQADAAQPAAPQGQPAAAQPQQAAPAQSKAKSGAGATQAQAQCDWVCPSSFTPPENGVYQYFQCGRTTGQCTGDPSEPAGVESIARLPAREFPRTGHRIVTTTGPQTFTNEHVYAEEHREQFDLAVDPSGVYNSRYKVEINFGPTGGGSEMRQQPPFKLTQWPLSQGLAWSGSWTDSNRKGDADYGCKAVAKEELNIGGTKVRTWAIDCQIQLKGPENSGQVLIKFWVAPEFRTTVQELYDQKITTPQGPYDGRWMVTLANLKPSR
jgi:hypothetical protein